MSKRQDIQELGTGKLLIAQPFMQDSFFKKSVIFLTDYHEQGTVGFIINRPLRVNIKKLISDFPKFSAPVYSGGPVQEDNIHYLHTAGKILDGSKEVIPGVYWGGDFHQLKFLVSSGVIGPHDIRFYVGYSGWSPGQLESEMGENSTWLVSDADPNYIFHHQDVDIWKQVLSHKSKNYSLLASMNDDISFN